MLYMVEIRKEQGIQIQYQINIKKLFIFKKIFFLPPPRILKAPTKIFWKKILIHKP